MLMKNSVRPAAHRAEGSPKLVDTKWLKENRLRVGVGSVVVGGLFATGYLTPVVSDTLKITELPFDRNASGREVVSHGPAQHCELTGEQKLKRGYSQEYIAGQLGIAISRASDVYGLNVHCERPLSAQQLEHGIRESMVGKVGQLTFQHCVLLPATDYTPGDRMTRLAQAYCLQGEWYI